MLRGCDRARGHSISALYLLILLIGIVFWSEEVIAQLGCLLIVVAAGRVVLI